MDERDEDEKKFGQLLAVRQEILLNLMLSHVLLSL